MFTLRSPAVRASLVAAGLAVSLAACGGSGAPKTSATHASAAPESPTNPAGTRCSNPDTDAAAPVALVLGVRSNSAPPLPLDSSITELLDASTAAKTQTVVVDVDGSPHTAAFNQHFSTDAPNDVKARQDLDAFQSQLLDAITGLKPKTEQADDLTALETAASDMRGPGTIVFADSGLQTVAPLDFTKSGLLTDSPQEVVAFLKHHDLLPKLSGDRVRFAGLGAVAPPQQPLDQEQTDELVKLWTAIVTAAGACVESPSLPAPSGAADPVGLPEVSPVSIPAPPTPNPCGTTVLPDSGTVGFTPGTADFRDPATARAALSDYVDKLQPYEPDVTVQVVGTTATWGTEAYRIGLSKRRAQTVAAQLRELGVPQRDLVVKGVGTHWPTHVVDVDSTGALIPQLAEKNRSVVLVSTCGAPSAR